MCEYCVIQGEERKPLYTKELDFGLLGKYDASDMIVLSSKSNRAHIEFSVVNDEGDLTYTLCDIKYCPVCGRNLLEEE